MSTPEISVDALANLGDDAQVIDVREPAEFVRARVPGALLMPMGQVPQRMREIRVDAPVYVVCASGNRSAAITDLLVHRGYDAYNVAGGTYAWQRAGRPVETGLG